MNFPRMSIKTALNSWSQTLGRDQVLNIVDEWLHETAPIHDEITSIKPGDIDVNFTEIMAGQ